MVRQMKVTAAEIGRYGTTGNGPGCEAYLSNRTGVTHNHDCRSRIRALMEKDEEGQQELAKDAERAKRRTEELLRKESMKDPKVAGEEAAHDEQMQQEKNKDDKDDPDDGQDQGPSRGGERIKRQRTAKETVQEPSGSGAALSSSGLQQPAFVEASPSSAGEAVDIDSPTVSYQIDGPIVCSPTVSYRTDEPPDESMDASVLARPGHTPSPKAVRGPRVGDQPKLEELQKKKKKKGAKYPTKGIISEYYSPPRVTCYASEFGLQPGRARDFTKVDELGNRWDFPSRKCARRPRRR